MFRIERKLSTASLKRLKQGRATSCMIRTSLSSELMVCEIEAPLPHRGTRCLPTWSKGIDIQREKLFSLFGGGGKFFLDILTLCEVCGTRNGT